LTVALSCGYLDEGTHFAKGSMAPYILKNAKSHSPTDTTIGPRRAVSDPAALFVSCALVMAANAFLWFWNYAYMFTAGLNSASPEFTHYYRSLFWGEVLTLGIFAGVWGGWLVRTGREHEVAVAAGDGLALLGGERAGHAEAASQRQMVGCAQPPRYAHEVGSGTSAPEPAGWSFPGLFKTKGGTWLLVTEAALDESYCGSRFAADAPGGVYRLRFPEPGEGMGVGEVNPTSTMPWTMPWRVVIIGDAAARIAESDLVSDLSPPSRVADTSWIKPGRASWSWWWESDSPKHAEALNRYVDLAADMGWEYSLVDANWNFMETGKVEDVVAHAREKGVGLLFWYNSGGPHNDVTEAPRDRMLLRDVRRAEFAKLRDWGVRGVKVDFWQSDKQDRIQQYRDVLADAAEFHLLVNFHGCTLPRGWSREFPHLVGMEGVMGAESYKFSPEYAARSAWHNTVLPFTRNVPGEMDYTPVTFSDSRNPHVTTFGHELALSVVFESGLQHYADSVDAYRALPTEAIAFLKAVPAAWDESKLLAGEPGKLVVVARRKGNSWFIAGISGTDVPQTVTVGLSPLGAGPHSLSMVLDGTTPRALTSATKTVAAGTALTVDLLPRGGFVAQVTK
jgi:hypothetical protein